MDAADACASASRRRASSGAGHRLVSGLAVGQAHQPHDVAQGAPLGGRASGLDIGIVGMGADDEHTHGIVRHGVASSRVRGAGYCGRSIIVNGHDLAS